MTPQTTEPPVIFMLKLPAPLKLALEAESTRTHQTMSSIVKQALALRLNFNLDTIPKTSRGTRKYNTPQERIAAQKAREAERNETIRTLLKAYKAGQIKLPPKKTTPKKP